MAAGGSFDLSNVTLASPVNGTTVALPCTFQWAPRAALPSDRDVLNIYDPHGDLDWYGDPPGPTGSYTLMALPPGVTAGSECRWCVAVLAPDGGEGFSWTHAVTFSGASSDGIPARRVQNGDEERGTRHLP